MVRERFGERLREFVLFGSQARGQTHEESDIDLLVVIDDLTGTEHRELLELAYTVGAAGEEYLNLSPLAYSTAKVAELRSRERRLMREIARDGIWL